MKNYKFIKLKVYKVKSSGKMKDKRFRSGGVQELRMIIKVFMINKKFYDKTKRRSRIKTLYSNHDL